MKVIEAVERLATLVTPDDLFVSSIGQLWDDWWNHRPEGADNTFFPTILGGVSPTAIGLAIALPHRRVVALETDGSMLMNASVICTLANEQLPNLTVVVFDNGIYESIGGAGVVGGPATHTGRKADLARMAEAAGCEPELTASASELDEFSERAESYLTDDRFGYLVARVEKERHKWPKEKLKSTDGVEDKYRFIRYVEGLENITVHRPLAG
jgi:thiamine pyrophosphate-dependent acetolactate synthase large subunit-like protein